MKGSYAYFKQALEACEKRGAIESREYIDACLSQRLADQ
jgi:hypothetical protein